VPGLPAGGAKLVLVDRPDLDLAAAYRFLGDVVERCGGRVYTGPDVGTNERELAWLSERTRFATDPGPDGPGELAAATCAGVVAGIEAALRHLDGEADFPRRTVVVQGLGEVGSRVAETLVRRGARVLAAEADPDRAAAVARRTEIELVEPASELDRECDVLAPCALGGFLHDLTVVRLRCRVIAGAANNVLAAPEHGDQLHERGILYVPDFAINGGALIRGARFHLEGIREDVASIGARIGDVVASLLVAADEEGLPPVAVAEREARARVEARRREAEPGRHR
jgi:leucine dehydrogenase